MPYDQLPGHHLNIPNLYPLVPIPQLNIGAMQNSVMQGFDQLNKVIDEMSPLSRKERMMHFQQMQYQQKMQDDPAFAAQQNALRNPNYQLERTKLELENTQLEQSNRIQKALQDRMTATGQLVGERFLGADSALNGTPAVNDNSTTGVTNKSPEQLAQEAKTKKASDDVNNAATLPDTSGSGVGGNIEATTIQGANSDPLTNPPNSLLHP